MTDPSLPIRLTGTDEPVPERRTLVAGPLTAVLEAGALRSVAYGGHEAIRGIAFVVRDRNWGTYGAVTKDLAASEEDGRFHVTYGARCADDEQALSYDVEIEGRADGTLEFRATGITETDFTTNRVGFAVLHPIEGVAGAPCTVFHADGSVEEAAFPDLVMPSQPFFDIRTIAHDVAEGLRVSCTMEGDAYEMEDQRNWTDASFKTYIRPLSKPRPFTIAKGEGLRQRVALRFDGTAPAAAGGGEGPVTVAVGEAAEGRVPELSLAVAAGEADAALAVADHVSRAGIGRLVCTVDARADGEAAMARFAALAGATGARLALEAVLPLTDPSGAFTADHEVMTADVARIAEAAARAGAAFDVVAPLPACYLASHQPVGPWPAAPALEDVYAATRAAFPGARIAGGMHSYFTELNRKWPPVDAIDIITHSTAAMVHAADDVSVMETLEALPAVFRTVKAHAPGRAYWIGPTAIGMRFNPYGAGTMDNPDNRRIAMAKWDPRQRGLLNAAWTLGYLARAAVGGVDAACLSAPTGPFGIAWTRAGQPQPWYDEHGDAAPLFPVYHVLAGIAPHGGQAVRAALSSRPGEIAALAVDGADGPQLWLANLTAAPREVAVEGFAPARIARLDADGFAEAARDCAWLDRTEAAGNGPFALGPYAVVRAVGR